ncbi:outer membrane beta-barrel protein [Fulvivirgaceae bacterium BMA10]|uniref:Outer membrane beta-barrel protein n=1 Tax=Splendidivirga corallicola TaxID=3051826 RepID=A0ABT8KW84_9BACT|nr:outer membrane beta-barrel protein [Fulvivirgaceae bacterium BMA10]
MKTVNIKRVSILFVAMLLTSFGYGQDKLNLKLKAGATASKLIVDHSLIKNFTKNTLKPGFYIGLGTKGIKLSEKSSLDFELLYSQKGALSESEGFFHEKVKLHYVSIPILYNRTIIPKLNIYVGVEAGALIDSRIINGTVLRAINNQYLTGDLGLISGLSYNVNQQFYFDFRWVEGLTRLAFPTTGPVPFDARNRSIQLGMGYKLF